MEDSGGCNYYNSMSMSMNNMGFGDNSSSNTSGGGGGGGGGLSSMAKLMLINSPTTTSGGGGNKNHFVPVPWTTTTTNNTNNSTTTNNMTLRSRIMAHPLFPKLLAAYANCQKVGAPPEMVDRLEEACGSAIAMAVRTGGSSSSSPPCGGGGGEDPALDQFMEAYCEMLTKYHQEITKPFKEAMIFLSRIESQFKALTVDDHHSPNDISSSDPIVNNYGRNGSSSEEADANEAYFIDPQAEDKELKGQLLRRYSGYLGSLKQDFLKKKKKGKLPKEARQQLLEWWSRHYKWPYPSEAQKLALAEATGLDQKQINNWFINQRKRHWKPSEDMQLVVMEMDTAHNPHYLMDSVMANPFPMDFMPT